MRGALSRMLNHSPAIRNKKLKRMCKIYLSEDECEKVNEKQAAEFKDVAIRDNENSLGQHKRIERGALVYRVLVICFQLVEGNDLWTRRYSTAPKGFKFLAQIA